MRLGPQIGGALVRVLSPMRESRVFSLPCRPLGRPESQHFTIPAFGKSQVYRPQRFVLQDSQTSANLLLSISPGPAESTFRTLTSTIYRFPRLVAQEPSVVELSPVMLPSSAIGPDLVALILAGDLPPVVSQNLFSPICRSQILGEDLQRKRKATSQTALFPGVYEPGSHAEYKKAYRRIKTKGTISTHTIQTVTVWDQIYLVLLPPINLDFVPQIDVLEKLRPYQKAGISFLIDHESALLADEMGTGKTVMAIVALRILFRLGKIRKALVICPVSVLGVWQDHLRDWGSELEFTVVRGTKETRKMDWEYPAHVYVSTYETIASDFLSIVRKKKAFFCRNCRTELFFKDKVHLPSVDQPPEFKCPKCGALLEDVPLRESLVDPKIFDSFDIVIVDEAQYIKNAEADRSRAVKLLRPKIRWALTGTPFETRLDDLVSIFGFVKPNYVRAEGLTPNLAKELIKPFFLRRLKKDVLNDLPAKTKQQMWLELDDDQRLEYNRVLTAGRNELTQLGEKVTRVHIFAVLTKLKRICNFAQDKTRSPKTEALLAQVQEIKESGRKGIVFTQWADSYGVETLQSVLNPFGTCVLRGGMTDHQREEAIAKFRRDPGTTVLIATVKTGGVGLTLTEANYVFHFDHWWNPATMWQAEDRVHRHGQEQGVNIYSYWVQNTIEENIYEKLHQRGLLFDEVVNGLSEKAVDEMFSSEEWLEMLGVKTLKPTDRTERRQEQARTAFDEALAKLSALKPLEFEDLVTAVFGKLGFSNARTTKRSHDGGIDIVANRMSIGRTEKVIAQCKRMDRVGVDVGRELLGVIAADPTIAKAFLVTSGLVSQECRAFCERDGRLAVVEGPLLTTYAVQFGLI
jgi:superfamily II DNA or RNA helicase